MSYNSGSNRTLNFKWILLKLGTGNGQRATGNGQQGTGVWEQVYSGNTPENSKWRTTKKKREKKCYGCKREFLPDVPPDDQYVLDRAESNWFWDRRSMKWRLGRKSSRFYQMLLQSIRPAQSFLNRISSLHSLLISYHFVCELS